MTDDELRARGWERLEKDGYEGWANQELGLGWSNTHFAAGIEYYVDKRVAEALESANEKCQDVRMVPGTERPEGFDPQGAYMAEHGIKPPWVVQQEGGKPWGIQ